MKHKLPASAQLKSTIRASNSPPIKMKLLTAQSSMGATKDLEAYLNIKGSSGMGTPDSVPLYNFKDLDRDSLSPP